jgi:hypothetical protein
MASTYSTNLGIELIGTGDQSGTWGATTNTNMGTLIEQAVSGYSTQVVTDSGVATALLISNGASSTGRNYVIELTGALTAARTVTVPAVNKPYTFFNNTTGGFAVTVKVSGQTGVIIANGKKAIVYTNSTDVIEVANAPATEAGTQTLTNKTLTAPVIGTIVNTGTLTLPTSTDTLVGRATTDTLTNKTLTSPLIGTVIGGTTASSSLTLQSTSGVGTTDSILFKVGNNGATTAMTITTAGNVGIGGSPLAKFSAASSGLTGLFTSSLTGTTVRSNGVFRIQSEASGRDVYMQFSDNVTNSTEIGMVSGSQYFCTAGSEAMRIDTSGSLLVGTTASLNSARLLVKGVALCGTAGDVSYNSVFYTPDTTNTTYINVLDYRVTNGTDHTTSRNKIQRRVDSTDMGYVGFDSTGTSIGWQNSEAMRIDTSGNLLVGTTSAVNGAKMAINSGTARALELVITTTANSLVQAFDNPNGTVGGIYTNGTATSYSTSSDYRLKNNIQPIDNGLATVSTLKPVFYKWNTDSSYGEGFIAHELQEVVPLAVNGDKDAMDDEGNPLYQAVDYSKIVVHLVAAIQELTARLVALEARLAKLENV